MKREQLIKRIKQTAFLEGEFVLRSGRKSTYYLDKYLFETCPDILKALAEQFASYVTNDVTLIAGAELGGVALAAAIALETGRNFCIIRNTKKGYGTGKLVEGLLGPRDTVLLVEDIATTGGQVIEAAKVITDTGAKLSKIVACIDRQEGAKENITAAGYDFESIMTKKDLGITN
ncbi:MAG: orotate phosphoribosyltransferase [Sedimentisphaerales bacterium]|nr:orotate phosphoribosyltransferase [Sedimentisphaerales bacterium]